MLCNNYCCKALCLRCSRGCCNKKKAARLTVLTVRGHEWGSDDPRPTNYSDSPG